MLEQLPKRPADPHGSAGPAPAGAELDLIDAELVPDDADETAAAGRRYLATQHALLGPGELPPLADPAQAAPG
ncbi:hypothetical protein [Streptomyces sp. NPDC089799]|uniref:hypothetical protein n=1 Tax=Streptomyces sp. NPDC089799 TaxID=3155066 RepID=UPI0034382EE9